MGSLVRFVIERSRLTFFLILLVIMAGVGVYLNQARQEDPEITLRKAQVVAEFPGLGVKQVEELLIKPIEEVVKTIPEVETIESLALPGRAVVLPEVGDAYFDMAPIWTQLRNKMNDLRPRLPQGTKDLFVNDDFGRVAVITLALTGEDFSPREMRWQARAIRNRIAALPLAAKVDLFGVQEEQITLELDPVRLNRLGINPATVVTTLQQQNIIMPGGSVTATDMKIIIRPSGDFQSVDEIRNLTIPAEDKGVIYLSDVLNVRRGYIDPPISPVYFNGKQAVILGISMVEGSNIEALARQLNSVMPYIQADLPLGMELSIFNNQPELVAEAVAGATENLWQTVVVVLVVVMLFLGLRTGIIVGIGIPLTIMFVLVGMSLWGIALHRISIAAVIVALGLLVDNGIVVAEDVQRRLGLGQDKLSAAVDSAAGLALPLLISSLTTILAFLPLMLAQNTSGEFLSSLTQVVILALLASWLLAVAMTPSLCYWLMPKKTEASSSEAKPSGAAYVFYEGLLRRVLRFRFPFLVVLGALIFGALVLMGHVKQRNMPPSERAQFIIYLSLPAGTDITATIDSAKHLTGFLSDPQRNPEITANAAYVASGGPRFFLALQPPDPLPHSAFFVVNLAEYAQLTTVMNRVEDFMAEKMPEARGRCETLFLGQSPIGTVETRISGPEISMLQLLAEQVMHAYRSIPGVVGLRSDWENPVLSMKIEIDQDLAARAGISSRDVARTFSGILDGYYVSDYREGENVIPIFIRSDSSQRNNLDALRSMEIYSEKTGRPVPLTQIARLEGVVEPSQIRRLEQERTVTIAGKHQFLGSKELHAQLAPILDELKLPPGYFVGPAGELAEAAESQGELFKYAPHCLLGILALLIFQFNSYRKPLLVMATIPLILPGAILGLYVFKAHFEFPALLGIFSLAGIIINNSIVLIDRIDQEREEGAGALEAAVSAALIRARPIIITTTTTVVGLIPLALFGGEFWFSMSIVIMCGLSLGTIQSLFFVPAAYSLLYK